MKWTQRPVNKEDVAALCARFHDLGKHPVRAHVMVARGLGGGNAKYCVERQPAWLRNPFLFDDMETAVDRLGAACDAGEKVRIFGDRDVDGITSTTLLYQEIGRLGADVDWRLPEGDDPYGLTVEGVDQAKKDGVSLIITVDCGISAIEEISHAEEEGIDCIVIDHHISGRDLPPADAIIDPKMEGSGYPFPHLAACGVVAKVIWALRFSRTPLYGQEYLVFHCWPGKKDDIHIDIDRCVNLLVEESLSEVINPEVGAAAGKRVEKWLGEGLPVYLLDEHTERVSFTRAFGGKLDHLLDGAVDIRKDLDALLPDPLKGQGVFRLREVGHASRYAQNGREEIETVESQIRAVILAKNPELGSEYCHILDLAAIGTVADMMPMTDENRLIVRIGLSELTKKSRPQIQPLLARLKLGGAGRAFSSTDISWTLSPVLNAAGRLGHPDIALKMLLAPTMGEAEPYAEQLVSLNEERKKLGEKAWDRILPLARESFEESGSKIIVVEDPELPRGITGLMAGRLTKEFKAPAIVMSEVEGGRISGSMRSPKDYNCTEFLSHFSDLFQDYGGHAYAGGFSMETSNLETFRKRLSDAVDEMDCPEEKEDEILIDCAFPCPGEPGVNLTSAIIEDVSYFEPYGEDFPNLVFAVKGARVADVTVLGAKGANNHLKITLSFDGLLWPALWWSAADKYHSVFEKGDAVDVAFRISRNYWKQQVTTQLTVLDLKRA